MKIVITTINEPNKAIEEWSKKSPCIIIGDKKTPDWKHENYYSIERQSELDFEILKHLPLNHYSRKNIGYLLAMGEDKIYDTDDDNYPNDNWKERELRVSAREPKSGDWCNIYRLVTSGNIWPRGFSLKHLQDIPKCPEIEDEPEQFFDCPIQQGLADINPDVDAIWRLAEPREVYFWYKKSFVTKKWCPFNSQSTWWFPEAYPLMYLPVYASFRMTDIWRSFVAQRCLRGICFHSPSEVYQDRNPHDLIKDFADEIPGYLNNHLIAERLDKLVLGDDIYYNMRICYWELINMGILPANELTTLNSWIYDVKRIMAGNANEIGQGRRA